MPTFVSMQREIDEYTLILVNSTVYGGSGGEFPISSMASSANEIAIHELGHSLFNLLDEYYPGDGRLREDINSTQESDPSLIKWKNWLNNDGVGVYAYGTSGEAATWNRPHQNCKMRYLGRDFCAVCKEGMVEKIHDLVSPVNSFSPNSDAPVENPTFPLDFELTLIKPNPNTLESVWTLNGTTIGNNVDMVSLSGSGDVWNEGTIKSSDFSTAVAGSGDLILSIDVDKAKASVSGSGDLPADRRRAGFPRSVLV